MIISIGDGMNPDDPEEYVTTDEVKEWKRGAMSNSMHEDARTSITMKCPCPRRTWC